MTTGCSRSAPNCCFITVFAGGIYVYIYIYMCVCFRVPWNLVGCEQIIVPVVGIGTDMLVCACGGLSKVANPLEKGNAQ